MRLPGNPLDRFADAAGQGVDTVEKLVRLLPRAAALLDSAEELVGRGAELLTRLEQCELRIGRVISDVARSERAARGVIDAAGDLEHRVRNLLDSLEPEGPPLLDQVRDVLPTLAGLKTIGPDLHELLGASEALNEMMGSVPGLGRAKKRVEAEHADDGPDR